MSDAGDDREPDDTMRERAGTNRLKLWALLDADRRLVAAVPVGLVFVSLVAVGAVDPVSLRAGMAEKDPVETLFQALVTAIVTGVTLVVSLNQLVLSQELGPLGEQRDRMEGTVAFRDDVAETLDVPVSPPEPATFLRALVEDVAERADELGAAVDGADHPATERIDAYVDGLRGNARRVSDDLEGAQFGTFDALSAALDFNYAWKIYEGRRIRDEHDESLSREARDALDDLVETLHYFGPAREHVKTLYFRWELVDLSRAILFSSIPALGVSMAALLYLDTVASLTGSVAGVDVLVWVVSAAAAVALVPFALLLSYVLRIATVAKRTLSVGPFILRDTTRDVDDEQP